MVARPQWRGAAALTLWLLTLCAIAYLLPKVLSAEDGLDFRLIWTAGAMWASGADPYSPAFLDAYRHTFGDGPNTHFWVYPPHWYPIATLFSLMPFKVAVLAWKMANFGVLMAATFLVARAVHHAFGAKLLTVFCAGVTFVCTMQATAVTISIGQTSILLYLGTALVIYGLTLGRDTALVAGLVFASLKPNAGIVFMAAVIVSQYRRSLLKVGAIGLICAYPVLVSTGIVAAIRGFIGNVSRYNAVDLAVTQPPDLTGMIHLVDYFLGVRLPVSILVAASALAAIPIFWRFGSKGPPALWRCVLCTAVLLLLVPLHSYDMLLLTVIGMTALVVPDGGRWFVAAGLLLALRAGNLAAVLGIHHSDSTVFAGSLIESMAVVTVFIGCVISVTSRFRERRELERVLDASGQSSG